MTTTCKLTALMTVHNGGVYLRTAMESILNQTYRDFRFLVVDDASTDESREIVRSYDDERIELLCLERNVGQTAALNIGLRHAMTRWIARMDADDYSAPTRLEEQMQALEADPSLGCIGTFCWIFREDPRHVEGKMLYPVCYEDLKRRLLKGPPMTHGSIIVNRNVLLDIGAYDERYRVSADLELYERLLKRNRAVNLPRLLYGCRRHPNQENGSRLALEENIDIWRRKLAQRQYTTEEASIVCEVLSGHIIGRVGLLWAERSYRRALKDLSWALSLSPRSVIRWYAGSFGHRLIPVPLRERIRKGIYGNSGEDKFESDDEL